MTDGGGRIVARQRRRAVERREYNRIEAENSRRSWAFTRTVVAGVAFCVWGSELEQDRRVDLLNQTAEAGCARGVSEGHGSDNVVLICKTVLANSAQYAEDRDIIGAVEMNSFQFDALRVAFEQKAYEFGNQTALSNPNPSEEVVVSYKDQRIKKDDPIYAPS